MNIYAQNRYHITLCGDDSETYSKFMKNNILLKKKVILNIKHAVIQSFLVSNSEI